MHNFTSIASLLGVILIGLSASGLRTADRPHRRHQQDWAAGRPAEQPSLPMVISGASGARKKRRYDPSRCPAQHCTMVSSVPIIANHHLRQVPTS